MNGRSLPSPRDAVIGSCLEQFAAAIQQTRPGGWRFVLSNGTLLPVQAQTKEGWLILEAPIAGCPPDEDPHSAWTFLRVNAGLNGSSRVALLPDWECPRLRADIPLDDETDLVARVREACVAFLRATHAIAGGQAPGVEATSPDGAIDLRRLCMDAGWTCAERESGRLMVDLGVDGWPDQACVERQPNGDVHASVELVRCDEITPSSCDALSRFLLTTCGLLRLARAAVEDAAAPAVARFEVRYAAPPSPVEIAHALAALSVACALFGREAQALRDDRTARAYLATRARACNHAATILDGRSALPPV